MKEITPTPNDLQPLGSQRLTVEIEIDFLPTGEITNVVASGRGTARNVSVANLDNCASLDEQIFNRVKRAVFDELRTSSVKTIGKRNKELGERFDGYKTSSYVDLVADDHIILDGSFSREDIKVILHIM